MMWSASVAMRSQLVVFQRCVHSLQPGHWHGPAITRLRLRLYWRLS
jgi:hypothetical protein